MKFYASYESRHSFCLAILTSWQTLYSWFIAAACENSARRFYDIVNRNSFNWSHCFEGLQCWYSMYRCMLV